MKVLLKTSAMVSVRVRQQERIDVEAALIIARQSFPELLRNIRCVVNEHNLDVEVGVLKPEKQQLVLKNLNEVVQTREVVRRLSVEKLRKSKDASLGV